MLKSVMDTIRVWRRRQDCIRELSRLTVRELAEIGIYRSEIAAIARETAAD
jgi:uncharacterized protein YjiS (DUF1127 family)